MAPDSQKQVPLILWFSESFHADDIDMSILKSRTKQQISHDSVFHTILGLLEVETDIYNKNLDITNRFAKLVK